ncbi:MAG: TonB-dependent receptor [Gracilimonas sp.]|uniref:TonB-dependent receptor n=1 Tax=Gracilimonas sp. TaxID=1974203 RepID=UPI001B2C6D1C|nr:carboxypeptidase-like regulatory domain-containing protein [Gracilimonas sp.]MBO6585253.1 TonB-dependent receptor [Gracilimonas sp.]MBO6615475.1 TonB-dependent receptor [Gracilimonas sp.]
MSELKKSIFLLLLLLPLKEVYAQNNAVRGIISDQGTGEALISATVSIQTFSGEIVKGTVTDNNGHYQINNIDRGDYIFKASYVGYQSYTDTIRVINYGGAILKNITLSPSSEELGEVTVSDRSRGDNVGQTRIQPETIGRAPTPAGSADLVSYIQTQPGVLATGDRGGQLFVRGGTPSENMVLMDGTLIYQPFHIVGFFSVFPEDVVSSADFYAGGFGPKYSGRSSSVMDVRLKNGNLYEPGWSASVSPFISDLFVETPVKKGKSSLLFSMRGSLIEETSDAYLQEQQPLKFNSQLMKFNSTNNEGLGCSALLMRTYDRGKLNFDSDQYFKWSNAVAGTRCFGTAQESSLSFMELNFGLSNFNNEAGGGGGGRRTSNIFKSNLDLSFVNYVSDIKIEYGFFANYRTVNFDILNRFNSLDANEESFLTTGLYLESEVPVGKYLSLKPGLVANSYMIRLDGTLEPRFRFSLDFTDVFNGEFHGAAGVYLQPLIGLADLRDAGTAFTAWMLPPGYKTTIRTTHYLLGWRQTVTSSFDFTVEGYFKTIEDTPISVWNPVAQFTTELAYADGTVRGIDARLNFNHKAFYAAVGYGYSITEYETSQDHFVQWFGKETQRYNPPHDRRHQINAQLGFDWGNFSANLNWIYGSGLPYTQPKGFDSFFNLDEGVPEVRDEYGTPRVLLEKPFQGNMPDFHRFDVSLQQKFQLPSANLNVQLGAINLYDQQNLFYYDVFSQRGINQLPIVPYVALKVESK